MSLEERSGPQAGVRNAREVLDRISREIGWYEEQARQSLNLALQYKIEIGRRLARAKDLLPHGQFLRWAQRAFGWTPRHVQNHLILAENAECVSHLPVGASLRMALAAVKESQPPRRKESGPVEVVIAPVQRIHLIGEIRGGTIDPQRLISEVERIAAKLGAPRTRWRAR